MRKNAFNLVFVLDLSDPKALQVTYLPWSCHPTCADCRGLLDAGVEHGPVLRPRECVHPGGLRVYFNRSPGARLPTLVLLFLGLGCERHYVRLACVTGWPQAHHCWWLE